MRAKIPRDAHAMIIGAMKCGTTSLFHYLCSHPEICPALTKEPEFFSENQWHGLRASRYEDLFPYESAIHKFTLEGSTGYTKFPMEPNVPRNISGAGLRPKFIYVIRDPFERIESHYNSMRNDSRWTRDLIDDHLVNTSNYFLQLQQYRRYFPLESVMLLDFDDLEKTPAAILEAVYKFLGISPSFFPESYPALNQTPSSGHKRTMTESERDIVSGKLKDGMRGLFEMYGFDSRKWGFD